MGGYVAHDAVASATRSPLSLKRHSMLTWTEKGERLDGEMHSITLFSDAYTRQVEALTHKSPFRRFIQSTHMIHEHRQGQHSIDRVGTAIGRSALCHGHPAPGTGAWLTSTCPVR